MTTREAKALLKEAISEDGGLHNLGWYLGWKPGRLTATLDGEFTAKQLMAIAIYMTMEDKS